MHDLTRVRICLPAATEANHDRGSDCKVFNLHGDDSGSLLALMDLTAAISCWPIILPSERRCGSTARGKSDRVTAENQSLGVRPSLIAAFWLRGKLPCKNRRFLG